VSPSNLFTQLGLFVRPVFLELELCAQLRSEIKSSMGDYATVWKNQARQVDLSTRQTFSAQIASVAVESIKARLLALKPELEQHFNLALGECEKPQFLSYGKGDFFRWHRDRGYNPNDPESMRDREVSVVVFLNAEAKEPTPDTYMGGALEFYGYDLVEDLAYRKRCFSLTGETGLLIAFPSDVNHQVQPVTGGDRYTIVTWFMR